MMMRCEFCGCDLPAQSTFCGKCGQKIRNGNQLSIEQQTFPGQRMQTGSREQLSPDQLTQPGSREQLSPDQLTQPGSQEQRTFPSQHTQTANSGPAIWQTNVFGNFQPLPMNPQVAGNVPEEDLSHEIIYSFDDANLNPPPSQSFVPTYKKVSQQQEEEEEEESRPVPFLPPNPWPASPPVPQAPPMINLVPTAPLPQLPSSPPQPQSFLHTSGMQPVLRQHPMQFQPTPPPQSPLMHNMTYQLPGQVPSPPPPPPPQKPSIRPSCLITSVIVVVVTVGIFLGFIFWHPIVVLDAHLVSPPFIGSTTMLYGEHFSPDETLIVSVDQSIDSTAQSSSPHLLMTLNSLNLPQASQDETNQGHLLVLVVDKNGVFTTPVRVNNDWEAGSQHKIFIYDKQQIKLLKIVVFTVSQKTLTASLQGCSTNDIHISPILEGTTKPVSTSVTLCTTGDGPVTWTALANTPWLNLPQNGQIQAPGRGALVLQSSAKNLKPGIYKTTLNLSSKESHVIVSLDVYFSVLKKGTISVKHVPTSTPKTGGSSTSGSSTDRVLAPNVQTSCLSVNQKTLSFSALEHQQNVLFHPLLLGNCGDWATWSSTVQTDNGPSWLGIGTQSGTLESGASSEVSVNATSANLKAGTYKGHIQFKIGSQIDQVDVVFTVSKQVLSPCLNSNKQELFLYGIAGQSSVNARVLLANCGAAGHWTATIQTNDTTNWLTILTNQRTLKEGELQAIDFNASALQLGPGVYTARVSFIEGSSSAQVTVKFMVEAPCFRISSHPLVFSATENAGNPASQSIWIENCGTSGAWYASTATSNGIDWLHIDKSNGQLDPKGVQQISVSVSNDKLKRGVYTGQVLIATGPTLSVIPVTFLIQPPEGSKDCLSVSDDELNFTVPQGQGESDSQTLTLENCGDNGQWNANIGSDGSWLRLSSQGDFLEHEHTSQVQVSVSASKLKAGTYSSAITFTLRTVSHTVRIHLTVQPPAIVTCIRSDTPSVSLTLYQHSSEGQSSSGPNTAQSQIHIDNCGDAGNWNAQISQTGDSTSWLHLDKTQNPVDRHHDDSIPLTVSNDGLNVGSYTATVVVTITTAEGAQDSVSIPVTLNIVQPPPSNNPPPKCIASPGSLTFTGVFQQNVDTVQKVTFENCDTNDSWTLTDTSGGALYISDYSGTIDANGMQTLEVKPTSFGSVGEFQYSFTLTTGGGQSVTVPVTVKVTNPANSTCIKADGDSHIFNVTRGQKEVMNLNYTNCGSLEGTISINGSEGGWLSVAPGNNCVIDGSSSYQTGSGPNVLVSLDSTNLAAQEYDGVVQASITTSQKVSTFSVQLKLIVSDPLPPPDISTPTPMLPTPTPAIIDTPLPVPTDTPVPPTVVPTDTPVPPTVVPTDTSVPPTVVPTDTPVPPTVVPTDTPVPPPVVPTDTPVPPPVVPTDTPVPPTVVPTDTSVPPTVVPTDTPVPPPVVPTDTPVPPTVVPTDTPVPPTVVPTDTPVPPPVVPTDTPVPPPVVPTDTPVPPPVVPTDTPVPPPVVPTDTPVPPPVVPTDTPIPCTPIGTPTTSPVCTPTAVAASVPVDTSLPASASADTSPASAPVQNHSSGDVWQGLAFRGRKEQIIQF